MVLILFCLASLSSFIEIIKTMTLNSHHFAQQFIRTTNNFKNYDQLKIPFSRQVLTMLDRA